MTRARGAGTLVGVMDVGGGHVTAALVDPSAVGEVVLERTAAIDPHAPRDVLLEQLAGPGRALAAAFAAVLGEGEAPGGGAASGRADPLADRAALGASGSLRGWSVAMPGPFDAEAGRGTFAGVDKFRSIAGIDLRSALADRLGVPSHTVRFCNDAVAYGIGEWVSGAGVGAGRMVCITLGTGVGSAFLADGRAVDAGPTVPEHGEVHRLTIDGRPLEETISSPALRRADRERTGRVRSVEELCAAARDGDPLAREVVGAAMTALGSALAPWVERFGADLVVVGGAIARSWDVIEAPLRAGLSGHVDRGDDGRTGAEGRTGTGTGTGTGSGPRPDHGLRARRRSGLVPAVLGARAPLVGAATAWARDVGTGIPGR